MNKELPTVRPACRVTVRISPSSGSMAGIFWAVLIVSLIESGLLVMRIPYFWAYTVFEEAGFERSLRTERHMVNNQFIELCGGVHFQFQHDSVPRIFGIVPRMVQDALQ